MRAAIMLAIKHAFGEGGIINSAQKRSVLTFAEELSQFAGIQ